jgi:hypothetical protein
VQNPGKLLSNTPDDQGREKDLHSLNKLNRNQFNNGTNKSLVPVKLNINIVKTVYAKLD